MGPEGGGDSHQSHSLDQPVESVLPLIRAPHVEQREEAIEMGLGCFNVSDATLLYESRQSSTFIFSRSTHPCSRCETRESYMRLLTSVRAKAAIVLIQPSLVLSTGSLI